MTNHRSARLRLAALLTSAMLLAACSPMQEGSTVSLPITELWRPAGGSATPPPAEAERRVALAVWGIGENEAGVSLLRRSLQGSAIAVADDALLAACDAARGQASLRIARRSSVHLATVEPADPDRRLCVLRAPDVELTPIRAYRPFEDMRVGEPVVAVSSETSRRYAVSRGRLVAKGSAADPYLETTLTAPPGSTSVAVFDTFGNLVGFGAPDPMPGSLLVAFPIPPAAAPRLAAVRIGETPAVLATLEPAPEGGVAAAPSVPTSAAAGAP